MWSTVGPALGKIAPIAKIQNLTTKPCYPIFQSPCQTLGLLNLYMFLGQKLCIRTSERPLETLIPWLGDWVGDKNFCICSSEELLSLYTWGWTPPNLFGPSSSNWTKERDRMCLRFWLEVEYLPPIVILSNHQSHFEWCNLYLYFNLYFYRASELSQIQKQIDVATNDPPWGSAWKFESGSTNIMPTHQKT